MSKSVILFFLACFLSGCAAMQAEEQRKAFLEQECITLSAELKKHEGWTALCMSEDKTYLFNAQAEKEDKDMMEADPNKLCSYIRYNYDMPFGDKAQTFAIKRKINCEPIIAMAARKLYSETSLNNLCLPWYNRQLHSIALKEVDKVVKERGVDCVSVINGMKQQAAIQEQNAEIRRQTQEMSRQTQELSRQSRSLNSLSHSVDRPRTCYTTGSMVHCY